MEKVKLANSDIEISRLGLGCMGMSSFYSPTEQNEEQSLLTIKEALDSGINLFDTSDIYGPHTNELLLGKAIKKFGREKFVIATKFGIQLKDGKFNFCATPQYVKEACEGSLKRLGIDYIDLYYLHRVDPNTPIEETVKGMKELVKEGKVKAIGLSEASAETIRRAHKIHPISAIQTEYSLWSTDVEENIIPTCRELGITFVAYSPLGRGFLTGRIKKPEDLEDGDFRKSNPRFQGENFYKNIKLVERVKELAQSKGCTPAQLCLAWILDKGKDIVPIPGTKQVKYLKDNIGALKVKLSDEDRKRLNEIPSTIPIFGTRYEEREMSTVNTK